MCGSLASFPRPNTSQSLRSFIVEKGRHLDALPSLARRQRYGRPLKTFIKEAAARACDAAERRNYPSAISTLATGLADVAGEIDGLDNVWH